MEKKMKRKTRSIYGGCEIHNKENKQAEKKALKA
jgi:hypothetical protein